MPYTRFRSQGNYFSCLIFCKDKDKNMILFFYHSLLPFGVTDLKMMTLMMMTTKNTKSNYLHWICILENSVKCIQWQATYPRFVEKYCMSSQISVYSLTFVHIYIYKYIHESIHGPDHSSLWFFIFIERHLLTALCLSLNLDMYSASIYEMTTIKWWQWKTTCVCICLLGVEELR